MHALKPLSLVFPLVTGSQQRQYSVDLPLHCSEPLLHSTQI
jgi:hypothetical protein